MPEKTSKLLELAAEMRVRAEEVLARCEVFEDADARRVNSRREAWDDRENKRGIGRPAPTLLD